MLVGRKQERGVRGMTTVDNGVSGELGRYRQNTAQRREPTVDPQLTAAPWFQGLVRVMD